MAKFRIKINPKAKTITCEIPVSEFTAYAAAYAESEVDLNISEEDYLTVAKAAHKLGVTLDHFVERVLTHTIIESLKSKKTLRGAKKR